MDPAEIAENSSLARVSGSKNYLEPGRLKGRRVKIIPPSNACIRRIFTTLSLEQPLDDECNKILLQGTLPQKEWLGFDLVEHETTRIFRCREKASPEEVRSYMQSCGYNPISCTITDLSGIEHTFTLFSKNETFLIHSMDAFLVNKLVVPLMDDNERFKNPNWIFNYQEKICASVMDEGKDFYYSNFRIGLIILTRSENIVDVYPRDKLSPTGFRNPDIPKEDTARLEEQKEDIAAVRRYISFFQNYKKMLRYADSIIQQIALAAQETGDPTVVKEALSFAGSFSSVALQMEGDPFNHRFLASSPLTEKIKQFSLFITKNKDLLSTPEAYLRVFGVEAQDSSVQAEVDALMQQSIEFDKASQLYRDAVLHKKASEWGPKWGHPDVIAGTSAYVAGRVFGRTGLSHSPFPYNEIDIAIPKNKNGHQEQGLEIAAFKVDDRFFTKDAGGEYRLDCRTLSPELDEANQKFSDVRTQMDLIKKANSPISSAPISVQEEYERLSNQYDLLWTSVHELRARLALLPILQKTAQDHIPVLIQVHG